MTRPARTSILRSPAPWLLVAIFAPLLLLATQVGVVGIPLVLILGSWFLKYGFMVLDHAAEGRPGAPVLTVEAANPIGESRPLLYGAAALVFWFVTLELGDTARSAARVLGLFLLPAIVATHFVTGSFARALDPRLWLEMLRRIGGRYALIVAFALAGGTLARTIVLQQDGLQLAPVLRVGAVMMLWLLMFALLGHVIHARRREIGFDPEHSPEQTLSREQRAIDRDRDKLIDQLFAETRAHGAADTAWKTLQAHAAASADPLNEYPWLFDRLAGWTDTRLARRMAREELLPRLLQRRRTGEALQVARRCMQMDPEFRPRDGRQLLQLAQLARDAGDRTLARRLLGDFERHFPEDDLRDAAKRLSAELERK
jgi:hypothetical protein